MAERDKSPDEAGKESSGVGGGGAGGGGGRRFRLPKLFADSDEATLDSADAAEPDSGSTASDEPSRKRTSGRAPSRDIAERADALGVALPAPVDQEVIATANRTFEGLPRASVMRVPADAAAATERVGTTAPSPFVPSADDDAGLPSSSGVSAPATPAQPGEPAKAATPLQSRLAGRAGDNESNESQLLQEMALLRGGMEEMYRTLQEMLDQGQAQDKVFNTLHSELQDYKNDFIYEHLKPVVRPLLFLYDSMEQFDSEIAQHERPQLDERRRSLSPHLVRENVAFFLEQLVEALRICEVTPMQTPQGQFDPRLHKAVDAVEVGAEADNAIQRVVRSGWYLNGRVFRPAEVVVGKKTEDSDAQLWNRGKNADS